MNLISRKTITLKILLVLIPICSIAENAALTRIINTSNNLIDAEPIINSEYVNTELITKSIYESFRPYIKVTNKDLSKEEINKKTHKHIKEKYMPVLVKNYTQIYGDIVNNGNTITHCNKKTFSNMGNNSIVSIALCVSNKTENQITVNYYSKNEELGNINLAGKFLFNNDPEPILIGIIVDMSKKTIRIPGV